MGSVLVCRELSEGATRWGDLLPQPRVGEGKHVLLLFFLLSCVLFIFPTHKRLRGPRFSRASVLAAPSPPHQERDQLRIQTLLTRGTQARAAHPK